MKNKPKRYTITSALPYANGPLHIGHLAGVYVPADIYVRYLRMRGEDVVFIGGSDEHGVPITIKARQEGVSPQQIVDRYHEIIKKSFEDFGISFDIYSRTSDPIHHKTASEFFETLHKKNIFIEKVTEQYYDEEAKQFLADRYITGTCPHCNNEKAYGDQCEKCGTSLNATDLINPHSVLSGNQPVMKETRHWFLPLDKDEEWLRKWILEDHKDDWKTNVYGQCKSWIDQGLQPRAVTRDLDWGVKVPLKEAEGKVLYVWFDAPIGYISFTRQWAEANGKDWELYWKDKETALIHFIGKDNIVFHCIVFPAMLKNEGTYLLPDNVPAFEFLNLEGDKISTSRNWAVWLHEYLQDFPGMQDVLRYVLASIAPETKDNDFTWKDFQARNNSELVAILGNFVNRTMVLTHKFFDGNVPPLAALTPLDKETLETLKAAPAHISSSMDLFRFREALSEFMNVARLGNKYLTDCEPWKIKDNPERVGTIINICIQICANLAVLAETFLPFTAKKIQTMLGTTHSSWDFAGRSDLVATGSKLQQPSLLFSLIEDSTIEQQKEKLINTKKMNEEVTTNVLPIKANIEFDDFGKMDLRTGLVLEAEKVAKTKKLMKLKVDVGTDVRTIVSGVAEYFEPEQLIGKRVVVLANLAPKDLKGITSQGMILFAENADGKLILVSPEEMASAGSLIK